MATSRVHLTGIQRTVHGHFKHAYSPMPRGPHPLGLRPDADRSGSSLAPPGPPPNFHGPPRPPSARTHSPMSMASWNPPFSDRVDSSSVRTSSLTSAVNGCRQVSSTFGIGRSGPVEPPPRYYDYTEDFENRPPRQNHFGRDFTLLPPQTTPYTLSVASPEDDDSLGTRHLAAVFGEGDSAFVDGESQVVHPPDGLPSLFVSGQSESRAEQSNRSPFHCRPSSAPSRGSTIGVENVGVSYKHVRSSDIDLLPSQSGRDSIDTFNPGLDVESKGVVLPYKYVTYHAGTAPKTETKCLERHVKVLGGRTPTIRSEQGIILRNDAHDRITSREMAEGRTSSVGVAEDIPHSPNRTPKVSVNMLAVPKVSGEFQRTSVQDGVQRDTTPPNRIGSPPSPKFTGDARVSLEEEIGKMNERVAENVGISSRNNDYEGKDHLQFRRHRRNPAALRISTTNLPRDDNEGHPHITPTCSTAPLISPKPISPARQLKVKNSIPQLMKALPPLPGDLGYNLPPTTTEISDEEDFAEILVPFDFSRPPESSRLTQRQALNVSSVGGDDIGRGVQRDTPRFRLKIKTSSCSDTSEPLQYKHQSRGDGIQPQSEASADAENGSRTGDKNMRGENRNKLKIRSPRRSRLSSRPSTVRRNPSVETSQVVTDLIRQRPQDLFSASPKSEIMLLRKRRSPPSNPTRPQILRSSTTSELPSSDKASSGRHRVPSTLSGGDNETLPIDRATLISAMPRRGLIKRLSNIRALLSSSSPTSMQAQESFKTNSFTNDGSTVHFDATNRVTDANQVRLGQRLRARLSRWVKGAEAVMRKRASRKHNGHGRRESRQT